MARAPRDDLWERILKAGAAGVSDRPIAAPFVTGISTDGPCGQKRENGQRRISHRQGRSRESRLDADNVGKPIMTCVSYTALRRNLAHCLDEAVNCRAPIIVARKAGKDGVVFMSEEDFFRFIFTPPLHGVIKRHQ